MHYWRDIFSKHKKMRLKKTCEMTRDQLRPREKCGEPTGEYQANRVSGRQVLTLLEQMLTWSLNPVLGKRPLLLYISPNSVWTHLGVLTVGEKQLMLRSLKRAAVTDKFAAIYSTFSRHRQCAFRLRRLAKSGCPRRALLTTALSLWCRVHFRTWWSLFVAGARETPFFRASKSTFRDRCKGSELLYFEMQFS